MDLDRDIIVTTMEKQVLEYPGILKVILSILIPSVALFNIYVAVSDRVWASAVLHIQLIGFILILLAMRSRIPELKKLLVYRYLLRFQILVFGGYILIVVGILHQIEVSPWAFIFVFLLSMWMPDRTGVSITLVFNLGLALFFLETGMTDFLANKEYLIRFYTALIIFSLLALSAALVRRGYLTQFFTARKKLKISEHKYRVLSRQLTREIQHRDRIEKRLHHAIKMETVGRVAAGVAHDLNNILSGLVTYPDLLLLDLERDHPLREPIETIKTSGTRAAAIVDDLLSLSRRGVAVAEPVDISRVTGAYLKSPEHGRFMEGRGISIETVYEEAVKAVIGSPVHISKSIMNLVTNGVEAITGSGKIKIRVKNLILDRPETIDHPVQGYEEIPVGDYVLFSISDTGAGIAVDEMESVFEPFFTTKQMGRSGTGLGMALVLGTVNDHKGFIQVRSEPGRGTRVALYFPATDLIPDEDLGLDGDRIPTAQNSERILVIDDEPVQLNIARRLLTRLGYRVHCAASGEAGLDFLKGNPADLVILDILMEPGMDGVETCERILDQNPDQRVLFVTGFSDKFTLDRARHLGRGECLFKPYTLERISAMIRNRLG